MISVEDKAIALLDHLVQTANGETNFRLHCLWCALPTSILLLQIGQTHTAIAAHAALVVLTCRHHTSMSLHFSWCKQI